MKQLTSPLTVLSVYATILESKKTQFAEWQGKFNTAIALQEGFVSLEFRASDDVVGGWIVVERFMNRDSAKSWIDASFYKSLLDDLRTIAVKGSVKEKMEGNETLNGGVTEVIVTEVHPEKEEEYRAWSVKIHQVEANFPGFRGVYIQSPTHTSGTHWITLLQFDTPKNLDRWLQSSERAALLQESSSFISALEMHRVASSYAGWFHSISGGALPPAWKQGMVVLLGLFPIVVLELKYLNPKLQNLDVSLATFLSNSLSVFLLSFPVMPLLVRALSWWLSPSPKSSSWNTLLGVVLLVLLYAVEISLFWNFF